MSLCIFVLNSIHVNHMESHAATFKGKNIWSGGTEAMFGHNRNYMYKWTDGWQMTFCISPGNHMGSTVTAAALRTNINDSDIPYIKSREDYEKLAVICTWFDQNGSIGADNATYAAAQTAVWAIMKDGWESADSLARLVDRHVAGTYGRWETLKAYVENTGGGQAGLPDWCSFSAYDGKTQGMQLVDGVWTVELDISAMPKLASLNWTFEGDNAGWLKSVSGEKLIFTYHGAMPGNMTVSAGLPDELKSLAQNTTSLNLYIPNGDRNKIQAMVSAGPYEAKIYVHLNSKGGDKIVGETKLPTVHIYRHSETFTAHYNLNLEKYCKETGKALEGSKFEILEAFEEGQLQGGLLAGAMTPKPSTWENFKVCAEEITNEQGRISHTDIKKYEYSRTYCDGHPEPEYMEAPEEEGDSEEEQEHSDENEAVEEINEQLRAQWEASLTACEAETDFHSEIPGEGLAMMLADRENTYEQFIHLYYDYTVQETQARYGYIRHGLHSDDETIPVIRVNSSEAGAKIQFLECEVSVNEEINNGSATLFKKNVMNNMTKSADDSEEIEEIFLPAPEEDDVEWISPAGASDTVAYTFQIYDNRTEGELHINKRDLDLWKEESDQYDSYGDTQGDATLEGAVYGLYAAEDIIHPDGKTGIIYKKDDLTATAATDREGNASFWAYTMESKTSKQARNQTGTWIGHPLLLGQYYVKEIVRSEGYELSVQGADMEGGNRHTTEAVVAVEGQAHVSTAMTHPIDMHDGSWLEFDVTFQNTGEGFDIKVSGFPENSTFYRSGMKETTASEKVVVGSIMVETGEYELAKEGEYKLDGDGNYIPVFDNNRDPVYDLEKPVTSTYYIIRRLELYPHGTASVFVDQEKWEDTQNVDTDYIKEETNSMLEQTGYTLLDPEYGDEAPWTILELSGGNNREICEEILEWFDKNSFWDSGAVHRIWEEEGAYKAAIYHDYIRLEHNAIYEEKSNTLYIRIPVSVESMGKRHMFLSFHGQEIKLWGSYATVHGIKQVTAEIPFLADMESYAEPIYELLYEQYQDGDFRLDENGQKIPVFRREFIYGEKEETISDYDLVPLDAVYDPDDGSYTIHVENTIDWNKVNHEVTEVFRAQAGEKTAIVDGKTMFYSDYLTDIKGAGASAYANVRTEAGSYVRIARLTYPGQISPCQDGCGIPQQGSKKNPITVQERIISQKIEIRKDVVKEEDPHSTQKGTNGKLNNFRFKIYLKSNLERLYRDESGKVVWINREGQVVDILSSNQHTPPWFRLLIRRETRIYNIPGYWKR